VNDIRTNNWPSEREASARATIVELFEQSPIPRDELLANLGLYMNRQSLSRVLFLHELYRRILTVQGIVIEFGVRWGQTLALFESFRGMYEPYNHTRRIVGFDSFSGLQSVSAVDGDDPIAEEGTYGVTQGFEEHLVKVLEYHEQESPLSHIRKFEVVKGEASQELEAYLERNPQTIVALAYFDFDVYEPTKRCLELIRPYLTRGSVLGFDELCATDFPGETVAVREVLGLDRLRIERVPWHSMPAFAVLD
jgi:hypothetical protein